MLFFIGAIAGILAAGAAAYAIGKYRERKAYESGYRRADEEYGSKFEQEKRKSEEFRREMRGAFYGRRSYAA
jgi:hypothetical protein